LVYPNHRPKVFGFFYSHFMNKNSFNNAAALVAAWAFIAFGVVLLGQAWGFLPVK
jgi:hypothetical protein